MKKAIVLAAALALFAAPAFAGIRNTKHDLSTSNANAAAYLGSTNYDEICVFCHTPHGANTAQIAPLWNRSFIPSVATLYNTSTLTATVSNPTAVSGKVNNSDAPLCLSCHDGASLTRTLLNPANSVGAQPTMEGNIAAASMANIGTDLSNDHPIGMVYANVTPPAEFKAAPAKGVTFYDGGVMWCSSCHDVHDNSKGQPFLVTSNAGSALCLECHVK